MKASIFIIERICGSVIVLLIAIVALAGCKGNGGTTDEDALAHREGTAVTVWTDSTEVFFEYAPMIAGQPADPWAIHVTRLADYSPIDTGALTLAFRGPGGEVYTTTSLGPARPGIFTPAPQLPKAGTYELVIDVVSPQLRDRVRSGSIQVYESEDRMPAPESDPGSAITFLKEQQWSIDFGVMRASEREIPYAVAVSGEIIPAAGHVAEVSAPVSGLALARVNLGAPASGDRVRAGQTLAVLAPTARDNSFAEAQANVVRLRREVDRLQRLYDAEAVPEKRLVEARHDLEIAEAALEAMGGDGGSDYTYTVRSPISGVVRSRHFVPGQQVEAGEPLFEVVDPSTAWLRLNLPARHAGVASGAESAVFIPEGSEIQFHTDRLISVGSVIDPESRTLPVILAVENGDGRLKIGQFVDAQLRVGDTTPGVSVPAGAVMNEDGQPVLYVQIGGESFERRSVVLGPTDGEYTIVLTGLAAGEHVVTEGGYQVYLASLGDSEIGDHGHPH